LDDEFLEAWKHGILVKCYDGVVRRLYLRIITYSADYPEKWVVSSRLEACQLSNNFRVLIALVRHNGRCPCPRCLVAKSNISMMGGKRDLKARNGSKRQDNSEWRDTIDSARALVHEENYAVNSTAVERIIAESSYVPTRVRFYFYVIK
jgi:hypothetical protein